MVARYHPEVSIVALTSPHRAGVTSIPYHVVARMICPSLEQQAADAVVTASEWLFGRGADYLDKTVERVI
jgi:hypothetical protein